jgi:hypothetical protein
MKKYVWFLFYIVLCGACSSTDTEQLVCDFKLLDNAKNSDLVRDYSIIPLETTSDNLILDATAIKLTKDRVFVLDSYSPSRSLYVFDISGKYLGKVGGVGEAFHEYIMPHYFILDEKRNNIIIRDVATNKILFYDMTTFKFIKSYKVPFYSDCFELLADGNLIWFVNPGLRNKGDFRKHIQITDMECNPVGSFIDPMLFPKRGLYNVQSYFTHKDNKTYFHHPFMGEYYDCMANENAFKQPVFSLNFEKHPFANKQFISEHRNNIIKELQDKRYVDWCDLFVNTSRKLCYFGVGKDKYWAISENNKGWYVNHNNLEDDLGIGQLGRPKGVYKDYFISAIYMETVESFPKNSILKSYVDRVDFGGNPLIILYK